MSKRILCRDCHADEAEREGLCYICYHDSVVDISIAQNDAHYSKEVTPMVHYHVQQFDTLDSRY
jgi:hypothetical protein